MNTQLLLIVTPEDGVLKFPPSEGKDILECDVKIKNSGEYPLAFKFRTNNIETYRVRPATGILKPGEKWTINIYKTAGSEILSKDKLVLISTPLESDATDSSINLETVWLNAPKDKQMQQTLLIGQPKHDQSHEEIGRKASDGPSKFSFAGITQKLGLGKSSEKVQDKHDVNGITRRLGIGKSREKGQEVHEVSGITRKLLLDKREHHDTPLIPRLKEKLSKPKAMIEHGIERIKEPFEAHYMRRKARKIVKYPGQLGYRVMAQIERVARKCKLENFWVISIVVLLIALTVLYFLIWENLEQLWKGTQAQNCFSRHPLLAPFGC